MPLSVLRTSKMKIITHFPFATFYTQSNKKSCVTLELVEIHLNGNRGLAVCLPVGLLLLQYSVLFTVESLSLLYLIVICYYICLLLHLVLFTNVNLRLE